MLTNICDFNREFENTKVAGITLSQEPNVGKTGGQFSS